MSTSVDDERILDVLRVSDEPGLTTTEVADQLPIARGTTRSRLQQLADDDRLSREQSGRHVVWWLTERSDEYHAAKDAAAAAEAAAADTDAAATGDDAAETDPAETTEAAPTDGPADGEREPRLADNEIAVQPTASVGTPTIDIDAPRIVTPAAGNDDSQLRALAVLAATVVAFALLRRLFDSDGE